MPTPAEFASALILTGPTACGKTALALTLAPRLSAEIVVMDSMTLYRGMDIGTAKPTPEARALVPHHLVDCLDPWESGSLAWWLDRAAECVRAIQQRGRKALFVGGTPLYLKAMLFGLFEGPPADPTLRQHLEAEAGRIGPHAIHQQLAAVDPLSASRLHPNDTRRIVRALEVYRLTGQPLSSWQQQWTQRPHDSSDRPWTEAGFPDWPRAVWLNGPREWLYDRINRRVETMLAAGWLDEVARLLALPQPPSKEAWQALGYSELARHLSGQCSLDEAVTAIQTRSRRFAKRQLTWLKSLPGLLAVDATTLTRLVL